MLMRKFLKSIVDSSYFSILIYINFSRYLWELLYFFCLDHPVSSVPQCHRCQSNNAEHWCDSDCKHSFCGKCWDSIHEVGQYKNHTKIPVKDKPPEMPACAEHTSEDVQGKYWCEGCSKEICGSCQQLKHKDHKFIIITEFVKDVQEQVSIKMKFFSIITMRWPKSNYPKVNSFLSSLLSLSIRLIFFMDDSVVHQVYVPKKINKYR